MGGGKKCLGGLEGSSTLSSKSAKTSRAIPKLRQTPPKRTTARSDSISAGGGVREGGASAGRLIDDGIDVTLEIVGANLDGKGKGNGGSVGRAITGLSFDFCFGTDAINAVMFTNRAWSGSICRCTTIAPQSYAGVSTEH